MALDTANRRPSPFIIDCCGHNSSSVLDAREDNVWIPTLDDDRSALVKVDEEVEWREVVCCLVWSAQIIHEKSSLEEGVLKRLNRIRHA